MLLRHSYTASGPSPRMRGTPKSLGLAHGNVGRSIPAYAGNTQQDVVLRRKWYRSIPAYAGNTWMNSLHRLVLTVHPRVCGEHVQAIRMVRTNVRSIPAYAGNTVTSAASAATNFGPSPRMRGTRYVANTSSMQYGPSPRMRGTPSGSIANPRAHRSIPAYAGNTSPYWPRSEPPGGPSPRMRGTRINSRNVGRNLRSIPAYAGNTKH